MTKQSKLLGLLAVAFILAAAPTFAGDTGRCYRADVATPIVLPDDSEHPPGTLKICVTRLLTPVSGLHEVSIDGRAIGLFTSRIRESESSLDAVAVFAFTRDRADRFVLRGIGASNGRRANSYILRHLNTGPWALTAKSRTSAPSDVSEDEGPTFLVAASR